MSNSSLEQDKVIQMFKPWVKAKIKLGLYAISRQHNYFTAIQPAFRYCLHGRAVCLCHAEVTKNAT